MLGHSVHFGVYRWRPSSQTRKLIAALPAQMVKVRFLLKLSVYRFWFIDTILKWFLFTEGILHFLENTYSQLNIFKLYTSRLNMRFCMLGQCAAFWKSNLSQRMQYSFLPMPVWLNTTGWIGVLMTGENSTLKTGNHIRTLV